MKNLNYDQAVQAYKRHCERNGLVYQEPDKTSDLDESGQYWELFNVRGLVARIDAVTGKVQ
ncbi:MAG: hypothetical protein R3F02_02240 [Thiolinea sp.]